MIFRLIVFSLTVFVAEQLRAEIIYSNTTTDTNTGINFDNAFGVPFAEVGDQISLAGTGRAAQVASVQVIPISGEGFFDATLRFYDVGASGGGPVGTQIGESFTVRTVQVLSTDGFQNIDFAINGIVLPDDVTFTLAISNLTSGLSLGLSLFSGPTIGRSDNLFLITKNSAGTFAQEASTANLYFSLSTTATSVPEPLTLPIIAIGFAATALAKRRRFSAA